MPKAPTMRTDRIDMVIASIKGEIAQTKELGFNMAGFLNHNYEDQTPRHCDTVACIAGHAYILKNKRRNAERVLSAPFLEDVGTAAQRWLGLDEETASELFYMDSSWTSLCNVSHRRAIKVLRHLKKTGNVDWDRFKN